MAQPPGDPAGDLYDSFIWDARNATRSLISINVIVDRRLSLPSS